MFGLHACMRWYKLTLTLTLYVQVMEAIITTTIVPLTFDRHCCFTLVIDAAIARKSRVPSPTSRPNSQTKQAMPWKSDLT
jgi:hypothetical protein